MGMCTKKNFSKFILQITILYYVYYSTVHVITIPALTIHGTLCQPVELYSEGRVNVTPTDRRQTCCPYHVLIKCHILFELPVIYCMHFHNSKTPHALSKIKLKI